MSELKQVIIVRTKYPDGKGGTRGVRCGKLIAQACHASGKVLEAYKNCGYVYPDLDPDQEEDVKVWLSAGHRKIVVQVDTADELVALWQAGNTARLPSYIIKDSGHTEFGGEETFTAVAIGPAKPGTVDVITGHLKLY